MSTADEQCPQSFGHVQCTLSRQHPGSCSPFIVHEFGDDPEEEFQAFGTAWTVWPSRSRRTIPWVKCLLCLHCKGWIPEGKLEQTCSALKGRG